MKTTLKTLTIVFSLMAAFLVAPASLRAADAPDEAALQKRLKERYPKIQQLKSQGVIGETDAGYVDFVDKKDSKSASLVDDENADRKAAYKLIADKEGITVDVVAKRAGK